MATMSENNEDQVEIHDGGMSATIHTSKVRAKGSHEYGLDVIAAADVMLTLRMKLWRCSDSFVSRTMDSGIGTFLLGHFITIHESFYTFPKERIESDDIIRHPFILKNYVEPVGNTSFTINNRCYDGKSGNLLIEERTTVSMVNLTTRRPETLSQQARQLARNNSITSMTKMADFSWSKSDFDFKQEDISTTRTFSVEVTKDDIDHYGHVNFLVYPTVAVSCLKKMLSANGGKTIACEHFHILYANESLIGDILEYRLYVAKNTDVYVHIYREDKCINKIKMASFYNIKQEELASLYSRL